MDARELTELLDVCEAKRDATDDNEGLLPCVGVEGAELVAVEVYDEPNSRFVDVKRRDGKRLEDEYCNG